MARRARGGGWRVAVTLDLDCDGSFRLEADGRDLAVHAGDRLGASYGWGLHSRRSAGGFRTPSPATVRPISAGYDAWLVHTRARA